MGPFGLAQAGKQEEDIEDAQHGRAQDHGDHGRLSKATNRKETPMRV